MLLDFPVYLEDSDSEFWRKVQESRRARDVMLALAPSLCPGVELGLVLQPRTPLEIDTYFAFLQDPRVSFYALPVRRIRNRPGDALGNAYMLSFLYEQGVKRVHFLGSNAPPVIFLLAKALSLGMFDAATFDSATWNTRMRAGFRYLEPETLSMYPPRQKDAFHPKDNLRVILNRRHLDFMAYLESKMNIPKWMLVYKWYAVVNIASIDYFTASVIEAAKRNALGKEVKLFSLYGESGRISILRAFQLLKLAAEKGHDAVKAKYGAELEEAAAA